MEGADEVLAGGNVNGCFAAHGAVHLGHDAGGYLDKGDTAVVDAGEEACHVAHHAATKGYDETGAVVPGGYHFARQGFNGAEVFAGFSGGECMQAGGVAAFCQAVLYALCVKRGHIRVGDDGGLALEPYAAAQIAYGFQRAVGDMHII